MDWRAEKQRRLQLGWVDPGPSSEYDDGPKLVGVVVFVAGHGEGVVAGFKKGLGSSSHVIELHNDGNPVRKELKLRRKNNNELLWLYKPPDGAAKARAKTLVAADDTKLWSDEVARLSLEGWRPPTHAESNYGPELCSYRVYVCGYGSGRVVEYVQAALGPSSHRVEFDDAERGKVAVRLRRKGNAETPWLVMPGLLHAAPESDSSNTNPLHDSSGEQAAVQPLEEEDSSEDGEEGSSEDDYKATPPLSFPVLSPTALLLLLVLQARFRGHAVRLRLRKSLTKRRQISQEMLTTEEGYVAGLNKLAALYITVGCIPPHHTAVPGANEMQHL